MREYSRLFITGFVIDFYSRLLHRACRQLRGGTLFVGYPDGTRERYGKGVPYVGLKIKRAEIIPRLLLDPELALGEAVTRGDLEIEGDVEDLLRLLQANDAALPKIAETALRGVASASRWQPLSMARDRRDIAHHYDLGNDFYARWLDASMTYSCAYFRSPGDDLETAQRQKAHHILRKLQLQPGETLLDIGCGWGALIEIAARDCGVQALGITLSEEQLAWFQQRNGESGAQMQLTHYDALAKSGRTFDKVVSVGMAEHVGKKHLPRYIADVKRLLKTGGLGLVHCITGTLDGPTNPWLVKHIFPGGYIPSVNEMVRELSQRELVLWDVENLGPHYALTLDLWLKNFERNVDWVEARYGAEFVRMWRLYLQFCAASFRCEDTYLHQMLFSNGRPPSFPLTREHLYAA